MGRNIPTCQRPRRRGQDSRGPGTLRCTCHIPAPPYQGHTACLLCSRTRSSPSTTKGEGGSRCVQAAPAGRGAPKSRQYFLPRKRDFFPGGLCSGLERRPTEPRPAAPGHSPYVEVLDVDVFVRRCLSLAPQEQPFLRRSLCGRARRAERSGAGSVAGGLPTRGRPHLDGRVPAPSHGGFPQRPPRFQPCC